MKKFVKIISVVMCALLLVTGFFFAPKNMTPYLLSSNAATTQAESGQTFYYNAELVQDNSSLGNYAITDVEYLNVNGAPLVHYKVTGSGSFITMLIKEPIWDDFYGICCNMSKIDNNHNYTNFAITCSSNTRMVMTNREQLDIPVNGSTYYLQPIIFYGDATYDLYFSYYPLVLGTNYEVTVDTSVTSLDYRLIHDNFDPLIDMNSSTSYSFNISDVFGHSPLMQHISRYYTNNNPYTGSVGAEINLNSSCYYRNEANSGVTNIPNCSFYSADFSVFNNFTKVSKSFDYFFDNFFFSVRKPSYRVDNTFFIYNFNYDESLNSFSSLTYQLRKGDDYYNVSYNGTVPNSKYLAFNCDDINNIIFDEYIFVDFKFINNKFNPYDYGFTDENQTFTFTLGFDMNFVYYTEPLITSNGSYNYSFNKPDYVSAPIVFKIAPPKLSLPIMAWAQNIFIFLIFYCPIISDIIELLHFDKFMAGLLRIFQMFIDSQIGDFVLGCFAFLILWGILSSLLPKALSSARSIYSNSQFAYNRRRNREDRQKERLQQKEVKYTQKMIKVEERYNKRRRKKE